MFSDLGPRVGTFLLLAAIGLFMIFVTYELGGTGHFDLFLISLILFIIGIRLKSHGKSAQDERFKSVRSISDKFQQKNDKQSSTKK